MEYVVCRFVFLDVMCAACSIECGTRNAFVQAAELVRSSTWKAQIEQAEEQSSTQTLLTQDILAEHIRLLSEQKKASPAEVFEQLASTIPKLTACGLGPPLCTWLEHIAVYCRLAQTDVNEVKKVWEAIEAHSTDFAPFKSLQNLQPFDQVWQEGKKKIKDATFLTDKIAILNQKQEEIPKLVQIIDDLTIQEECLQNSGVETFVDESLKIVEEAGCQLLQCQEFLRDELSGISFLLRAMSIIILLVVQWHSCLFVFCLILTYEMQEAHGSCVWSSGA